MVRTFGGWLNTYEPALQENFPDAKVKYIVGIENDEGECVGTSTLGGNIYGFVSLMSPAAGKEDAILGLLDYMLSDEGWSLVCDGVEGWTYTVENGEKVPTEAFADFSVYRNDLSLVRRYNDPGYFVLLNNADYDRSWQYIQARVRYHRFHAGYRDMCPGCAVERLYGLRHGVLCRAQRYPALAISRRIPGIPC